MTKTPTGSNKKWYMSRTLWANVLILALGIFDAYNASFGVSPEVYAFVVPVVNMFLRLVTDKSLSF